MAAKKIETKFGTYMEREDDPTKLTGDKIKVFVERLKKLGIEIKLQGNFPWVYIDSPPSEFTDIAETFKLIRKYNREALLVKMMRDSERDGLYDID
jgi:hypothetical protein